jgi:hypothetical protein
MVDVTLHKEVFATISVDGKTHKQVEDAIAAYLPAHKDEIVWVDNPKGIKADCRDGPDSWKVQKRFLKDEP